MATYTQTAGSADGTKYFQDLALTPANVKNGELRERLDTTRYPKIGVKFASAPVVDAISPVISADDTTLDVTVTGHELERGAVVSFSGTGITVNSTRRDGQQNRALVATITIAAGATVGDRDVIVTNEDGGTDTLSAAFEVTA